MDPIGALESLLAEAEGAHGVYETTELSGVYDEAWPRWYATYAVDHGIGDIVGREVTVDEVAAFLSVGWEDFQRADPKPTDPWSVVMARRIAQKL